MYSYIYFAEKLAFGENIYILVLFQVEVGEEVSIEWDVLDGKQL